MVEEATFDVAIVRWAPSGPEIELLEPKVGRDPRRDELRIPQDVHDELCEVVDGHPGSHDRDPFAAAVDGDVRARYRRMRRDRLLAHAYDALVEADELGPWSAAEALAALLRRLDGTGVDLWKPCLGTPLELVRIHGMEGVPHLVELCFQGGSVIVGDGHEETLGDGDDTIVRAGHRLPVRKQTRVTLQFKYCTTYM